MKHYLLLIAFTAIASKANAQVNLGTACSGNTKDYYSYKGTTVVATISPATSSMVIGAYQSCPQDTGTGYGCNSCTNPVTGKRNTLDIGGGNNTVSYTSTWTWSGSFQIGWNAPGLVGSGGASGSYSTATTKSEQVDTPAIHLTCPERKQIYEKQDTVTTTFTQYVDWATCDWAGSKVYIRRYNGPYNPGPQTGSETHLHTYRTVSTDLGCKGQKSTNH